MRFLAYICIIALLLSSCSSTVLITSSPTNAKVYVDGSLVGMTPYRHTDSKISFSSTNILLKKDGYEPFNATLKKDEKFNIGNTFLGLFLFFPLFWSLEYDKNKHYVMTPNKDISIPMDSIASDTVVQPTTTQPKGQNKAQERMLKLAELKRLYEQELITESEYEAARNKILKEITD